MGLFDAFRSDRDLVGGTAQVVAASGMPPGRTYMGRCVMHLVVSLADQMSFPAEITDNVRCSKWPMPGMVLPVQAPRQAPEDFEVVWDEVPKHEDQARGVAEQMARTMNGAGVQPTVQPTMQATETAAPTAADRVAILERLAALRDSGVIGEAEFEVEKARILRDLG